MPKRVLILSAICLHSTFAQGNDPRLATLSGVVTSMEGAIVAGARVALTAEPALLLSPGSRPASVGLAAVTNSRGEYKLEGVAPGTYLISISAPGFLRQAYGGKTGFFGAYAGRPKPMAAAPVTVTPGSIIRNLDVRLTPSSALSGSVRTSANDPAPRVRVYAVRWTYMDGTRRLLEHGRAVTNDSGAFRIDDLAPGEYFLYAVPPEDASRPEAIGRVVLPTFSPNALHVREALARTLSAGMVGFADVQLREDTTVTVRGTVVSFERGRAAQGATVLLMKEADAPVVGHGVSQTSPTPPPQARSYVTLAPTEPDGRFTLEGVVPGRHRLIAFGGKQVSLNMSSEVSTSWTLGRPQAATPDDGSAGSVEINVSDEDVDGIVISLRPGGELTLSIEMDGGSYSDWLEARLKERVQQSGQAVPDAARVAMLASLPQVTLLPESGISYGGAFPTQAGDSRGFTQKVSPGRFFVSVSGNRQLYYVKAIHLGAVDLKREPFEFNGGAAALHITLADDFGRVNGAVRDTVGNPLPGSAVSLWPVTPDESLRNRGAIAANSGHDGAFNFSVVPPGDYYAIAFEDLPDPGIAEYPPFVSQFIAAGTRLTVRPNGSASATLRAVSSREVERVLTTLR